MWKYCLVLFSIMLVVILLVIWGSDFGSRWLIRRVVVLIGEEKSIDYEYKGGSLSSGVTLENIDLDEVSFLPIGSRLRVQKLFADVNFFNLDQSRVFASNARLKLPFSDAIVISGTMENEYISMELFSAGIAVDEILSLLDKNSLVLKGIVNKVSVSLQGPVDEMELDGDFIISRLTYGEVHAEKVPVRFQLTLSLHKPDQIIRGMVFIRGGGVFVKDVSLNLQESRIYFENDLTNPRLDIKASSIIDGVKILLKVRGYKSEPKIELSSTPPLPKMRLMLMLATGQSWKGLDQSVEQGAVTQDLATDFVNYFFFKGKTNFFTDKLGLQNVSLILNQTQKGIGVTKGITDAVSVNYQIKQTNNTDQTASVSQTIGGEIRVTDKVAVGAERELQKQNTSADDVIQSQPNDKVYLKYQTSF